MAFKIPTEKQKFLDYVSTIICILLFSKFTVLWSFEPCIAERNLVNVLLFDKDEY